MKIEKLRNNHKKEIIIGIMLIVVIGGALTFRLTHSKYRVTQSIDLGSGVINYKPYDFKIMAMYKSDDKVNYNEITTMPTSGYVINEEKTYCGTSSENEVKGKIRTENGKHYISGLDKGDKCYLYFDKQPTASETILESLGINIKTSTPTFSSVSITNEGVFKTEDEMYGSTNENKKYTYYWRGAVTNNYVKFAGFCWRIIRINGDKTIRLIYDGSTCHENGTSTAESIAVTKQSYNSQYNASYYVGWTQNGTQRTLLGTSSNAKSKIETWYTKNLASYESEIADGKYCNDRDVVVGGTTSTWGATGSDFWYAARKRLYQDYNPTFNCPAGDVYTLKVGLITADEVAFAGGVNGINNTSYYLYNGQYYWTMSPSYWGTSGIDARMFRVNIDGSFESNNWNVSNSTPGLRPVINLKSYITFSSGNGEPNTPYIVN